MFFFAKMVILRPTETARGLRSLGDLDAVLDYTAEVFSVGWDLDLGHDKLW